MKVLQEVNDALKQIVTKYSEVKGNSPLKPVHLSQLPKKIREKIVKSVSHPEFDPKLAVIDLLPHYIKKSSGSGTKRQGEGCGRGTHQQGGSIFGDILSLGTSLIPGLGPLAGAAVSQMGLGYSSRNGYIGVARSARGQGQRFGGEFLGIKGLPRPSQILSTIARVDPTGIMAPAALVSKSIGLGKKKKNSWVEFVAAFRKAHPELKGKEVMQAAAVCYKEIK